MLTEVSVSLYRFWENITLFYFSLSSFFEKLPMQIYSDLCRYIVHKLTEITLIDSFSAEWKQSEAAYRASCHCTRSLTSSLRAK